MRLPCVVACLIVVSTCAAQSPEPAQLKGRIIGLVVNDLNEPIGSANLCTSIVLDHSSSTSCGNTADERGQFDIRVPLDTNRVFADKQDGGYQQPTMKPMGYGVRVKLTESQPAAHVTLKIGPRPAEIDVTVTDKATGKTVDSFTVRWIRIDDGPAIFVQSTKNRIFVSPDVDMLLSVQARGYERWFYYDVSTPSNPVLRLATGEQRTIEAELDPN